VESGTVHQVAQQTVLIVTHGEQVSLQYVHNQLQDKHSLLPQHHVLLAHQTVLNVTEQHVSLATLDTPLLVQLAQFVQELVISHVPQQQLVQQHAPHLVLIFSPQVPQVLVQEQSLKHSQILV